MVQRIKIMMNDYTFNLGGVQIDIDNGFESLTTEKRTLPYKNFFWNSITYEISLN